MNQYKIIIIGSGFGGQAAAINLLKRGIDDFIMLERRSFMGGTWCQNTYPGAAVDVQSPLYSISHEHYPWSQMFADGAELQEYTNYVIDKYKLREKTKTQTNVESVRWDEEQKRWVIQTSQGEFVGQFVVNASGPLSTPVIPNFKGKDSFKGISFHTNDWQHEVDLTGKRVAIIGSGASAAQIIPEIASKVSSLAVFQRSPHWVMPRHDMKFKPWQQKLLGKRWVHNLIRYGIYWGLETRIIGFKYSEKMLKLAAQNKALKHIKKQIKYPELRQKLTPDYTIGCKRIILSNTLYPALCRDNVTLYDKTQGIQEINETGIVTQKGEQVDLDIIIYSTGYDATDGVISYPVYGKSGESLGDYWEYYPRAYLGTVMPDYPNLFIVTGPNTGIGHTSAIFVIEAQMHYIMQSIETVLNQDAQSIEVKAEAETEYTDWVHEEMKKTVWHQGGCSSWYQSKSGKVIAMFPGFSFTYLRWAKDFKPQHHDIS